MTDQDPGVWHQLANWLWAVVLAIGGWAWKHTHKRIDDLESHVEHEVRCARIELKSKVDQPEMDRQRDNITDLFNGQETIRAEMRQGFQHIQEELSRTHVGLLEKLTQLGNGRK